MKQRQIYYRRKGSKIIAEGKMNGKTIFLFTIPDVETVANSSLFTYEKQLKINGKIFRLDYKPEKKQKDAVKVQTIKIIRTPEKDDKEKLNEILRNDIFK